MKKKIFYEYKSAGQHSSALNASEELNSETGQ